MGYILTFIAGFIFGTVGVKAVWDIINNIMDSSVLPAYTNIRNRFRKETNEIKTENPQN